ncbi:MAG: hypothetical protein NT069_03375, partial [Planctomycetota bacterium]|nr:hypothetical protein [Planctomycetota bacterium]
LQRAFPKQFAEVAEFTGDVGEALWRYWTNPVQTLKDLFDDPKWGTFTGTTSDDVMIQDSNARQNTSLLAGDDTMFSGDGWGVVLGGPGNDIIVQGNPIPGAKDAAGNGIGELYGEEGEDYISAGGGNDELHGGGGADVLYGGPGNDTLWGGDTTRTYSRNTGVDGGDYLDGGLGNDTHTGGAGRDTFAITVEANAVDVITDFKSGEDWIDLSRFTTINDFGDIQAVAQGTGTRILLPNGQRVDLSGVAPASLRRVDFVFTQFGTAGNDVLDGSDGVEIFSGLDGDDVLRLGGGNDIANGNRGNDNISGGAGDDQLHGGQGNDTVAGGEGNDVLWGGLGDDTLQGNQGDDRIEGGDGSDLIRGGQGSDRLQGMAGDDTLYGDRGDDLLMGGDGADRFVFTPDANTTDLIADFSLAQQDELSIAGFAEFPLAADDVVQVGLDTYLFFPDGQRVIIRLADAGDIKTHLGIGVGPVVDGDSPIVDQAPAGFVGLPSILYVPVGTSSTAVFGGARFDDQDSPNFDGGRMTLAITSGSGTLSLTTGSATPELAIAGTRVTWSGFALADLSTATDSRSITLVFTSNATPGIVAQLLSTIRVSSLSTAAGASTRFSMRFDDGDGGSATPVEWTIRQNAAPVIGAFDTTNTYIENGVGQFVDDNATITDVDSIDLNSGILQVAISLNGEATDLLEIRNQGAGSGQIGVNGSAVTFGGVTIGTWTAGTGLTPLTVVLNSNSTPANATALLRNVTFRSTSENPSTLPRTMRVSVTDGDGATSNQPTKNVNVTSVNDAPVVVTSAGTTNYVENGVPVAIDGSISVTDVDNVALSGGTLNVGIQVNGSTSDRLTIRNEGTAAGQIGVSGTNVSYGNVLIGTFSGGVGTAVLVVTLNSKATPAAVAALARNICFSNVSDAPSTLTRTVGYIVADGSGGTSATATKLVSVTATADAPVIGGTTGVTAYTENGAPIVVAPGMTVTDADLPANLNGGVLTVDFQSNGTTDDRLSIQNQGTGAGQIGVAGSNVTFAGVVIGTFAGGTGTTPLKVNLNSQATVAAVQALAGKITFANVSDNPSALARTVRFVLNDGAGATSAPATKQLTVAPVNDASIITGLAGSASFNKGAAPVLLAANAVVMDPDSADFATGTLVVSLPVGSTSADRLTIRSVGTGAGQIAVNASNVTYGGIVIGTFTGGTAATPLVITFNTSATVVAVQALVRSIQFQVVGTISTNSSRTVRFVLKDGDGGISANYDLLINVIGA